MRSGRGFLNKEVLLEKRQLFFGVVLVVLALVAYIKWLVAPPFRDIRDLQVKISEKKRSLSTIEKAIPRLPEMEAKIAHLRQRANTLKGQLPGRSELPTLLERLSEVAEKSDVKIIEISPSTTIQVGRGVPDVYEELPIAITAKSGYHELGSFINQLENSDRIFLVKDIQIQSDRNDQKRHHVRLMVGTFVRQEENP